MDSTTKWIYSKIEKDSSITKIVELSDNHLLISRKKGPDFDVLIISTKEVLIDIISSIVKITKPNFILNVPKDFYADGESLDFVKTNKIILGGLGDFYRFVNLEYNWPYESPEVGFIMRGLSQHTKVQSIKRLDSRRYEVTKHSLSTVVVLAINDYDFSLDSVRHGKERFKEFDVIVTSNPNAQITTEAFEFAKSLHIEILRWGELLGHLNKDERKH